MEELVAKVRPHVPALLKRDGNEAVTRVQLHEIIRREGLVGGRNDGWDSSCVAAAQHAHDHEQEQYVRTCRRFVRIRDEFEREIAALNSRAHSHADEVSAEISAAHARNARQQMAKALAKARQPLPRVRLTRPRNPQLIPSFSTLVARRHTGPPAPHLRRRTPRRSPPAPAFGEHLVRAFLHTFVQFGLMTLCASVNYTRPSPRSVDTLTAGEVGSHGGEEAEVPRGVP
ncbi:hypothetical protein OHB49_12255 [Streptomyces sp. NBC_01717]|uniref:hypothetical protein n=1 Tax=Streptomyces sp. NBC_01717 TaxID=2975918 RepID=UPI002E36F4D2|nr:hypothetical protein [Streptomyces sp. NBC_01717]